MSSEEVQFLPYEEASRIVAAIQEEEDIHQPGHRILTVYNQENKEICWFDFDEVMRDVEPVGKADKQEAVAKFIMQRIPDWALEL